MLAGGGGTRFGGPKQFVDLCGRSVISRSVATALRFSDGVVVVLPGDAQWEWPSAVARAVSGETRSQSTRNGLALVPSDATVVIVHDAARPLATEAMYRAVVDAVLDGADAAIPALAMTDTVKRVDGELVVETVARENLVIVQTPQAFRGAALRAAHASGRDDTDDAALVEAMGGRVVTVTGDPHNIKITVPVDLVIAQALLELL